MSRRNRSRYQQHNPGATEGDDLSTTPEVNEQPIMQGLTRPGLADVIARREAELTEELGEAPTDPEGIEERYAAPAPPEEAEDDGGTPPGEAPTEGKPAEPKAPDASAKPKEPAAPPEPPPTDADEIELVVDGAKVKKTKAEILEIGRKAAQKEIAADRRLEEAARIKREADEYAARVRAQPPAGTPEPPVPGGETPPAAPSDHDTAIKAARKAMIEANQYGDAEDIERAQVAYEDAILAKAAAVAKPSQAAPQLDPRAFREQLKRDEIAERFTGAIEQGGFADVWEDPDLRNMVLAEVDRALVKGAKDTDWATYENAGKKVRAWRDFQANYAGDGAPPAPPAVPAPGGKRTPAVDPTLASRADKKRQLPSVPTASGKAAVEDSTPTEEPDRASVIASMARARPGQG